MQDIQILDITKINSDAGYVDGTCLRRLEGADHS